MFGMGTGGPSAFVTLTIPFLIRLLRTEKLSGYRHRGFQVSSDQLLLILCALKIEQHKFLFKIRQSFVCLLLVT